MGIFRRSRVRYLRTLLVADTGVDVKGIGRDGMDDVEFTVQEAFTYYAPMAEVAC
jgi:hypothetical protein